MKKMVFLLAIGLILCTLSSAHATLIGIKKFMKYPDILFDGSITFTQDTIAKGVGTLDLEATDRTITYPNKSEDYLTGAGFTTKFSLIKNVWEKDGTLYEPGTVKEWVQDGTVTIKGNPYAANTANAVLLTGTVYNFGWSYIASADLPLFDFAVNNLGGALVNPPLNYPQVWPNQITGIFTMGEYTNGWTGNWNSSFQIDEVKGDKAPIPIPPLPCFS